MNLVRIAQFRRKMLSMKKSELQINVELLEARPRSHSGHHLRMVRVTDLTPGWQQTNGEWSAEPLVNDDGVQLPRSYYQCEYFDGEEWVDGGSTHIRHLAPMNDRAKARLQEKWDRQKTRREYDRQRTAVVESFREDMAVLVANGAPDVTESIVQDLDWWLDGQIPDVAKLVSWMAGRWE